MKEDLFSAATWLLSENNRSYGPLPIPNSTDDRIGKLLQIWTSLDRASRATASGRMLDRQGLTLQAYSERMASFAVRTRDLEKVFLGLVALGIVGGRGDSRENLLVLSLHVDAAQRLGAAPEPIFGRATALLSRAVAIAYSKFLQRSEADRSIAAMGYVASCDSDGFRYLRTW
jgi:hypothetical protein